MLVQAGAVPGQDFSCDPDNHAYRLNEKCYHLLEEAYPEIDWSELCITHEYDPSAIVESLHSHLGVPVVDNLISRIQLRLHTLPDAQAACYLRHLIGGIEQRTGLLLLPLLEAQLSLPAQARLEWLLRLEEVEICHEWLMDLVLAAGGSAEDVALDGDSVLLTERGIVLLETLWSGDGLVGMPDEFE